MKQQIAPSSKTIKTKVYGTLEIKFLIPFIFIGILVAVLIVLSPWNIIIKIIIGIVAFLLLGIAAVVKDKNDLYLFQIILRNIKFIVRKKGFHISEPVNLGKLIKIAKLSAVDYTFKSESEKEILISNIYNFLNDLGCEFIIYKTNSNHNFKNHSEEIKKKLNTDDISLEQNILNSNLELFDHLSTKKDFYQPDVYIIFFIDEKGDKQFQSHLEHLKRIDIFGKEIDSNVFQKNIFAFDGNFQEHSEYVTKITDKSQREFYKCMEIVSYPRLLNQGWLSELFEINNIEFFVKTKKLSTIDVKKRLDRARIRLMANEKKNNRQYSDSVKWEMEMNLLENTIESITSGENNLYDVTINVVWKSDNISDLHRTTKLVKNIFSKLQIGIDEGKYIQQKQFLNYTNLFQNPTEDKMSREFTTTTLSESIPLAINLIHDNKGFILGETKGSNPVIFNPFFKSKQRVNHNILVLGTSGSGKSFLAKKLFSHLKAMNSTKIMIIDPEDEYKSLTEKLDGGIWVDGAGSEGMSINPLEIIPIYDNEKQNYTNHINFVVDFFSNLFFKGNISIIYRNRLIYHLSNLYAKFSTKHATPTILDLQNYLEKSNEIDVAFSEILKAFEKDREYYLLWGQKSKFTLTNTQLLCISINKLLHSPKKVRFIQMELIFRWLVAKGIMANKTGSIKEPFMIVLDEAHTILNKNNENGVDFVNQMVKRVRKYNGSLCLITQNINDFVADESIKGKITSILNNTQYWFIGSLNPGDIGDLDNLLKSSGGLNEELKEYIKISRQGKFVFKLTNDLKIPIAILKTPHENY